MNKSILFFSLSFFLLVSLKAQKGSVEPIPKKFLSPKDLFENEEEYLNYIYTDGEREFGVPWMVISDRENTTYKKPQLGASEKSRIGFGSYAFVKEVSSDGQWIRIVEASLADMEIRKVNKDYGWVKKEKMLLWTTGLVSPTTGINRKGFLLNKVDALEPGKVDEIATVYKSPRSSAKQSSRALYRFFFVYKKENNRYLLCEEERIESKRYIDRALVGWVSRDKITEWNTRVALEPNFTESGFKERKKNKNKRLIGFKDRTGATKYSDEGVIDHRKVFWDNDPCNLPDSLLGQSNPRRFKGKVIRFPYLGAETGKNTSHKYIRSGVIGHILPNQKKEVVTDIGAINRDLVLKDELAVIDKEAKHFNLLFVVEGSKFMSDFRPQIADGILDFIRTIKGEYSDVQINVAFSVYRDFHEKSHGKLTDFISLTDNYKEAINSFKGIEFNNWKEFDQYTSWYFGLSEGLTRARFKKEGSTNMVISIGKFGDYRADKIRRDSAKSIREKTYVPTEEILGKFNALNVNFYSIQIDRIGSKACNWYCKQARNFLIENSKNIYNNLEKYGLSQPSIERVSGTNQTLSVSKGIPGFVHLPSKGTSLSLTSLSSIMLKAFQNSYSIAKSSSEGGSQIDTKGISNISESENNGQLTITEDELDVSSGRIPLHLMNKIERIKRKLKTKYGYTDEEIDDMFSKKIRLYNEVYFPKKIKGSKKPPLSYILYMPRNDLKNYIDLLKEIIKEEDGAYHKKRKTLKESLVKMLQKFAGDNDDVDVENITSDEIFGYLQGIKEEGLKLDKSQEKFKISEITDQAKVSDDKIDKFIERIRKKERKLYKIWSNPAHEFSYKSGSVTYYWIPVEDAF